MNADQPLLELIALKNAINEIEREKLSSKNGDNGHATFKSAGNWPSLSGLAETGSWTAGRRNACPAARGWPSWALSCRTSPMASRPIGSPGGVEKLAASRPPAGRDGLPSRPRAPPYHDMSYSCWRRISPDRARTTGRCAPQGGNCGILRQTRWDGSMKRRTLKWHLLLVLSFLVSCDCTRI